MNNDVKDKSFLRMKFSACKFLFKMFPPDKIFWISNQFSKQIQIQTEQKLPLFVFEFAVVSYPFYHCRHQRSGDSECGSQEKDSDHAYCGGKRNAKQI